MVLIVQQLLIVFFTISSFELLQNTKMYFEYQLVITHPQSTFGWGGNAGVFSLLKPKISPELQDALQFI